VTPIDWEQVSLFGRNAASGEVAAANGHPNGQVGRYLLEVTFPSPGEWSFEFGLRDLEVMNRTPTTVSVAQAAIGNGGTVTTGSPDGSASASDL
jgi:hypothetical protein